MVNNFVDAVRMEHEMDQMDMRERERRCASEANEEVQLLEDAKTRSNRAVVEAERFKATIAQPPEGMPGVMLLQQQQQQPIPMVFPNIGVGVSDDDFFHLTCHIEPNLIHKIEKGEFIELEKLLPKDKFKNEENRLEWVQKDGGTFLVPAASKDNKIGSFRCWEQAFRAYATIYCGANPHRSKEIWQYITVINTAASSYVWENVYNYDNTFRHLMAFNPNRSWAVTYNQMWNLSMRDPIPRNSSGQKSNFAHYSNGNHQSKNQYGSSGKKKPDYCWNFNQGIPCKFGSKYKFVERCKYCDAASHGVYCCPKLQKKLEGQGQTPKSGQEGRSK